MTRHWKLKSTLVAGMAALASTTAQAKESPTGAPETERPPAAMSSQSDGSFILAGNSS